jgi:hypothetical protein
MALCFRVERQGASEDQREEEENPDASKVRYSPADIGDEDVAYKDRKDEEDGGEKGDDGGGEVGDLLMVQLSYDNVSRVAIGNYTQDDSLRKSMETYHLSTDQVLSCVASCWGVTLTVYEIFRVIVGMAYRSLKQSLNNS